jgi:hypothetical protein
MLMEPRKSSNSQPYLYQCHLNYVNNHDNNQINTDTNEEQPDTIIAFVSNQKGTIKQDYKNGITKRVLLNKIIKMGSPKVKVLQRMKNVTLRILMLVP